MNAGRNVGARGIAVGLSAALAIGLMMGSQSLFASARQDERSPVSLRPVVYKALNHDVSPRLDSMEPIKPAPRDHNRVSFGKTLPSRSKMTNQAPHLWQDPVAQLEHGFNPMPSPMVNFDGVSDLSAVLPPAAPGAVGLNHYVQWVGPAFAVHDKSGTKLYPAGPDFADGGTLWQGFGGACESTGGAKPVTVFDRHVGRWLMSQVAVSGGFAQCIAISQTSDPMGAWNRYAFALFGNKLSDRPHFGVWPDGYYMTVDQFAAGTGTWAGAGVVAFERDKMLAGLPAKAVYFDLYKMDRNLAGQLPSDLDGVTMPPAGIPQLHPAGRR